MDRRRDGNQQSTEGYHPLLKAEIEETEQRFLVGRCKEIALIRELISTNHRKEKIVNIYGTGGVGKSYLLDEIRRIAISHSCMYLHIDARDFIHTSEALCKHLYGLLGNDLPMEDDLSTSCLNALNEASQKQKIILAFDTYEEMGDLEHWLREQFFRRLNVNILIVIAGRFPLQGLWRTSPAWRQLILRMPLADLDFESVKEYVSKCSINDERTIYDVWIKTKGHPLTLSLAVSLVEQLQIIEEDDLFSTVVSMWLREVSNKRVRELLEAAAVLRHFNQEILSYVLDRDVSTEDFTALISLSFVRRVKRGWILHDLIRATIANDMRQRMPSRYNELSSRCVLFHYHKIMDDKNANSTVDWERSEWFYYIGNNLVRSFFYQSVSQHVIEPLDLSNFHDAEHYLNQRRMNAKDAKVVFQTPDTKRYEYLITAEQSLLTIKHIHLRELYELDQNIVKLYRDPRGQVVGLGVVIPINAHTLGYLLEHPLSSSYFRSLPASKLEELRVPRYSQAGWFVKSIDVPSFEDETLRANAGLLFISYVLSGGYIVAAPPAHPIFRDIHLSIGCEETKDVFHTDYDEKTATPYYVIDNRGEKLHEYVTKMISRLGLPVDPASDQKSVQQESKEAEPLSLLTKREQQIALLLQEGLTNGEIANRLFVSEITIKKALTNMFRKYDVQNRTQFVQKMMETHMHWKKA